MSFLTFVLYFFASHLIYSIVMSVVMELYAIYKRKQMKNQFDDMLNKMVLLDQSGDDDLWH
jgi:hypothetical protein